MADGESGVWNPTPDAVERSELESEVASAVEEESLTRLRNRDDAPPAADEKASKERIDRGDPRLEAGDSEQAKITRNMSMIGWLIVLGALGGVLLMTFALGYLRELAFG